MNQELEEVLKNKGYKLENQNKPNCIGSTRKVNIMIATKDAKKYIVSVYENKHINEIKDALGNCDSCLSPNEIISTDTSNKSLVLFDLLIGGNLWELEVNERPNIHSIEKFLCNAIKELNNNQLVHADIRPWNIIWDEHNFNLIDFRFSYMFNGNLFGNTFNHLNERHYLKSKELIDLYDANSTILTLLKPDLLFRLWKIPNDEFNQLPHSWVNT